MGKDRIRNILFEPNGYKTAPDYIFEYLKHGSINKINLEVIEDFGCKIEENTSTVKKWPNQDRLKGFKKTMNKLDNSWIINGESITVSFLTKIPSRKECGISLSKLVNPCYKEIKALYKANKIPIKIWTEEGKKEWNKNPIMCYFSIVVKGKEFAFSATKDPTTKEGDLAIYPLPSDEEDFGCEEFQAQWGIKNCIQEKTEKLTKIEGEKWLAIHSKNYLLTKNHYIKEYHHLLKDRGFTHSSFTRIFVIFTDTDPAVTSDIIELTKGYEI